VIRRVAKSQSKSAYLTKNSGDTTSPETSTRNTRVQTRRSLVVEPESQEESKIDEEETAHSVRPAEIALEAVPEILRQKDVIPARSEDESCRIQCKHIFITRSENSRRFSV
jgi:hypothetical protein